MDDLLLEQYKENTSSFSFTDENLKIAKTIISHYPEGRQASAVLPLLDMAQRQNNGWLSKEAIEHVANILGMHPMRVHEVASFYSMFNLKPVGKFHIQVCGTTPCWLRGASEIMETCKTHLGISSGELTPDKTFSLVEVECLGSCISAPVVQINDDYYEDLSPELLINILKGLVNKKPLKIGSQIGRKSSEPFGFNISKEKDSSEFSK